MAGSVNKVIIVGNLGRDPEVRAFQNGGRVANLTIATSENWKDKTTGEKKERTEWHRVAIFNENLVGVAERYLKKGAKVYIEGQLETRKWQDQSGQDRYTTEVVLRPYRGELTMLDGAGGRDLVPVKKNVIEDELAALGMQFTIKSMERKLYGGAAYLSGHMTGQSLDWEDKITAA